MVAMRDDLLRALFVRADVSRGEFTVKFNKGGEWRQVTIDDQLPCSKAGTPVYGHSQDEHELWPSLLEKAYAKLHGSYQALEGGNIAEALVDLTGGAPEEIDLDDDDGRALAESGQLWSRLLLYQQEQYLLGCAYICDGAAEVDTGSGLLQNHAYGIMRVVETRGHRLIKCRNPWGMKEWNGDWSDTSSLWTAELRRELGQEKLDDGIFWIDFGDFCKQFNRVYVARLYQDDVGERWQHTKLPGEWVGASAGGCVNYAGWHHNPQYSIVPSADTELYVCVSQPDLRMTRRTGDRTYTTKLGFCLVRVDDASYALATHPPAGDVVCSTTFLNVRQISKDVLLKRGQQYVLVPSTFKAGEQSPFVVEIYARRPVTVKRLESRPVASCQGNWRGESAGGCLNHATWTKNPQFAITLDGSSSDLTVALQQDSAAGPTACYIGFVVVRGEHLLGDRPRPADLVLESQITNLGRVAASAPNVPAGTYIVVPSTFDVGVERGFTLEVAPATRVKSIAPAKERQGATVRSAWHGVTAGGCPNHNTWRNNPQFVLEAPASQRSGKLALTLSLSADTKKHIGLYVFAADGEQRRVLMSPDDIIAKSPFTNGSSSVDVSLDAAAAPYLILPCTFEAGVDADFTLKALGAPGVTLRPLAGAHMITMQSRWSGASAGGCTNHSSWTKNPKFKLHSSATGRVQLLLTVAGDATGLGILVVNDGGTALERKNIVTESDLMMGDEVGLMFEVHANQDVWVMPVTFDAGVERAFELSCYSSFAVQFG
jgi:hypothetical protein